tara:strand:+ start:272 stop:1282 length:1011 start_codon:yes stop_codon:yes gene_type:complete
MSKARELAELGAVYDSGALSNRNLIINGAMQVAQKGTSATTSNDSSTSTVDRFIYDTRVNGVSSGNFTIEQVTDAPTGFEYSFKITNDDNTTIGSSGGVELQQFIEGHNTAHLGWGASGAKGVTLSFWVKASYTGTQSIYFPSSDYGIAWLDTFTINAANTWEYKTLYIEGPTSGTWYTTTGRGMMVRIALCSNRTSGTLRDWTNTNDGVSGQTNTFGTTISSTFQITGVQLEVGTEATPFEHRSYGQELALCQRYYWQFTANNPLYAFQYHASFKYAIRPHPVEMRATPAITSTTSGGSFTQYQIDNYHWKGYVSSTTSDTTANYVSSLKADAEL